MCGIIGYTGTAPAQPILLDGLRALEYRGYDSAGISILHRGRLKTIKAAGRLSALTAALPAKPLTGTAGIGHTRWATHGKPDDVNAHPHEDAASRFAIVHNGIIENAAALRKQLQNSGVELKSETDTEVLAHLIATADADSLQGRVRQVLAMIKGTYGLAVLDAKEPGSLVAARNGSPVIIGLGQQAMYVASDLTALARHTREVSHLDDGEIALIRPDSLTVTTLDDDPREKETTTVEATDDSYDKDGHEHFMLKEIMDQPHTTQRTLGGRLDDRFCTAHLGGLNLDAREALDLQRVQILGCGSAYYAGRAGADMIETLARIPAVAEPAAEFRYRNPVIERHTLYIVVSQSGETFDTLAAAREISRKGGRVLGIVNSVGSTIAREVDGGIYMHAGPEVSVASTKAYTSMQTCFALLALHLARIRDLSPQQGEKLVQALADLPGTIQSALDQQNNIRDVARKYASAQNMFFIGKASAFPVALEGAQKLKEISYIHAEAYPASELKHGPLALVSPETPTVVVMPDNDLLEKSLSSLEEIKARSGPAIVVTNADEPRVEGLADDLIRAPQCHSLLHPIALGIGLQLFAYHAAVALGRDIDQPRNLAKSVTVE
ncbi:MAG: glutamine--fructose-6-phosphate transaminase (isomerizing) [Gammaproteobacteria bacterium]|nr:glutamine--fructose-6-phosphate transaminase (isomerizing) [Gammaproteobacteria bacterium]